MQTHKTYLAINRLMMHLGEAKKQLDSIRGMVKQLPKDWQTHAGECGYDDNFCTLLETLFSPSMVDRVNLADFLIVCGKLERSLLQIKGAAN